MTDTNIPGLNIDWNALWTEYLSQGMDFGIKLITALLILWFGRMIARFIQRGLHRLMQRQEVDKVLQSFISNLVYWALMVFIIVAAISQIGVQTTSFIAVIGAAGLAIGLAMQGALANFAAGVLIVLFRPYRVGDWVEAAGIAGSVNDVSLLTTTLTTGDNKRITVPNSRIMGDIITNYSANETRRVDMVFGASYGDDIDRVRSVLKEVVEADERVLADPPVNISVAALADSSVNFNVRPWVRTADYWGVMWDITEAVKKRFDQEGISIPFPQRDIHIVREN